MSDIAGIGGGLVVSQYVQGDFKKCASKYRRPADTFGAVNAPAIKTLEDAARTERSAESLPAKSRKLAPSRGGNLRTRRQSEPRRNVSIYWLRSFQWKVWELDVAFNPFTFRIWRNRPSELDGCCPACVEDSGGAGSTRLNLLVT